MRVGDLMSRAVRKCRPDMNLAEAAKGMWDGDCGVIPVVTGDGRVVGMVTDRDICIAAATRSLRAGDIAVGDAMSRSVLTCFPDDDVRAALAKMGDGQVRRLPVVDERGALVGILSLNDIARAAAETNGENVSYADVMMAWKAVCERRTQTP